MATTTTVRHSNLHTALGLLTKAGELVTAVLGDGTVTKSVRDAYTSVRDAERAAAADLQREAKSTQRHTDATTTTNATAPSTAVEPPKPAAKPQVTVQPVKGASAIPADAKLAGLDVDSLVALCVEQGIRAPFNPAKSALRKLLAQKRDGAVAPKPEAPKPQAPAPAVAPKPTSAPAVEQPKPAPAASAAQVTKPVANVVTKDKLLAEFAALGGNAGLAANWGIPALQKNIDKLRAKPAAAPATQTKPTAPSHKLFRSNGDLASLAEVAAYLVAEFGMNAADVQTALDMLDCRNAKRAA